MRKKYILGLQQIPSVIFVLQNKLKIEYNSSLNLQEIEIKIKPTHKERRKIKLMAGSSIIAYRSSLALAKEEVGEVKAATYLNNLNQIEAQRRLHRNIKVIEGKLKEGVHQE